MGLFDEVLLDPPVSCPACKGMISVVQTHAFDDTMSRYRVGDCPGHAEEMRVVRQTVWCDRCRVEEEERAVVYLVVLRGILVAVERDFEAAQRRLRSPSLEELALWYHDLYRRKTALDRLLRSHHHFLEQILAYLRDPERVLRRPFRPLLSSYFTEGEDAASAIEKYLEEHPAGEQVEF